MRIVHTAVLLSSLAFFGPPHIKVHQTSAKNSGDPALELEVDHHMTPEDMRVIGRVESVQNGRRVSTALTNAHAKTGRYTVAKQWSTIPCVLVFSAEEDSRESHGVAEALSIDASGAVKNFEYMQPAFVKGGTTPLLATREELEAALLALGVRESHQK